MNQCQLCKSANPQFACGGQCGVQYCKKACAQQDWDSHSSMCFIAGKRPLEETSVILESKEGVKLMIDLSVAQKESVTLTHLIEDTGPGMVVPLKDIDTLTLVEIIKLMNGDLISSDMPADEYAVLLNALDYLNCQGILARPSTFSRFETPGDFYTGGKDRFDTFVDFIDFRSIEWERSYSYEHPYFSISTNIWVNHILPVLETHFLGPDFLRFVGAHPFFHKMALLYLDQKYGDANVILNKIFLMNQKKRDFLTRDEAKEIFVLSDADLKKVKWESSGNARLYYMDSLFKVAMEKHGPLSNFAAEREKRMQKAEKFNETRLANIYQKWLDAVAKDDRFKPEIIELLPTDKATNAAGMQLYIDTYLDYMKQYIREGKFEYAYKYLSKETWKAQINELV